MSSDLPQFAGHAPAAYRRLLHNGIATLPYCERCARYFYYPRARCPRCGRAEGVRFEPPQDPFIVRSVVSVWRPHSPAFERALPGLMLACSVKSDATVVAEGWGWQSSALPVPGKQVAYVVRLFPDRGALPGFVPINSASPPTAQETVANLDV